MHLQTGDSFSSLLLSPILLATLNSTPIRPIQPFSTTLLLLVSSSLSLSLSTDSLDHTTLHLISLFILLFWPPPISKSFEKQATPTHKRTVSQTRSLPYLGSHSLFFFFLVVTKWVFLEGQQFYCCSFFSLLHNVMAWDSPKSFAHSPSQRNWVNSWVSFQKQRQYLHQVLQRNTTPSVWEAGERLEETGNYFSRKGDDDDDDALFLFSNERFPVTRVFFTS